jgi:hypothetical protein
VLKAQQELKVVFKELKERRELRVLKELKVRNQIQ